MTPEFIAGDWGTSNLRLFLCDAGGSALESLTGPGAAATTGRFAAVLDSLTAPWRERHGMLPTILCGMVGSSIGWTQAPYVECPARPEAIAQACVALPDSGVHIVPGMSCRNRYDAPDFMRGEETQILGALTVGREVRLGGQLLCLPGTHTKWALLQDGAVDTFVSAPTGEVFAALRDHSVLVGPRGAVGGLGALDGWDAFDAGISRHNEFPDAPLLHRLFEVRARQLSADLSAPAALDFLSGLLIAADVHGGLMLLHGAKAAASVCLIGAAALTQRYARALAARGCASHAIDGAEAALAGLAHVQSRLSRRAVA